MSESNDSRPWDLRSDRTRFFGKASDGFADILKIPYSGINENLVVGEVLKCLSGSVALNLLASLQNV